MEELDQPTPYSRSDSPLFEPSKPSQLSHVDVAINDQPMFDLQRHLSTTDSVVEAMPNDPISIPRKIKKEKEKSTILDDADQRDDSRKRKGMTLLNFSVLFANLCSN